MSYIPFFGISVKGLLDRLDDTVTVEWMSGEWGRSTGEMIELIIAGVIVYVIYRLSRALFTPSERKVSGRASGTPPAMKGRIW